ncbi:MAG: hypothetical protein WC637_19060, partial [Victivallales bacterium]
MDSVIVANPVTARNGAAPGVCSLPALHNLLSRAICQFLELPLNMKQPFRASVFLMSCFLFVGTACADVKLPRVFGDNMVLQQGREIPVW